MKTRTTTNSNGSDNKDNGGCSCSEDYKNGRDSQGKRKTWVGATTDIRWTGATATVVSCDSPAKGVLS